MLKMLHMLNVSSMFVAAMLHDTKLLLNCIMFDRGEKTPAVTVQIQRGVRPEDT